jgi:hypothetical protein
MDNHHATDGGDGGVDAPCLPLPLAKMSCKNKHWLVHGQRKRDGEEYLDHTAEDLDDGNPALVEGIYHDGESTAEGPQNADNDPSSEPFDPINGLSKK